MGSGASYATQLVRMLCGGKTRTARYESKARMGCAVRGASSHVWGALVTLVPPLTEQAERVRMLQLQLSSWLLGVLVLAVGILLPLGLAASRNKVLQQAWEKATGKTV